MSRRWLALTATLCAMVVVLSLVAAKTVSGAIVREYDGRRMTIRPSIGPISRTRIEPDPSLHVGQDMRREMERAGLRLSPREMRYLADAYREGNDPRRIEYRAVGEFVETPKAVMRRFDRLFPKATHTRLGRSDNLSALLPDGKASINIATYDDGPQTLVSVSLNVPKQ